MSCAAPALSLSEETSLRVVLHITHSDATISTILKAAFKKVQISNILTIKESEYRATPDLNKRINTEWPHLSVSLAYAIIEINLLSHSNTSDLDQIITQHPILNSVPIITYSGDNLSEWHKAVEEMNKLRQDDSPIVFSKKESLMKSLMKTIKGEKPAARARATSADGARISPPKPPEATSSPSRRSSYTPRSSPSPTRLATPLFLAAVHGGAGGGPVSTPKSTPTSTSASVATSPSLSLP